MKIICKKCKKVYKLDASLIKPQGSVVRCSSCKGSFKIYPPSSEKQKHSEEKAPVRKQQSENSESVSVRSENSVSDKKMQDSAEPPPIFVIVEEYDCPLYRIGDEFQLSDNVFLLPHKRPPCLVLVKDIKKIFTDTSFANDAENKSELIFSCSGCTGLIRFGYKAFLINKQNNYVDAIVRLLNTFPIFEGFEKSHLKELVSYLRIDKFGRGDFILRKGETGRNLFLIVSGKVEVLSDDGMPIAIMGKGDIFGEMSLLSGDPVGATVKVIESTVILEISGDNFRKVLRKFPYLQATVSRLIVRRMAEINLSRSEEFASDLAGKLSELPPSDLFQTFNINQKTGVLTLKMPDASAYLSFRRGRLVNVRYSNKEGEEAFFELLKLKEGRFKFTPGLPPEDMEAPEVGDFMYLLIEGLRRIDVDDRKFLRTVIPTLV